MCREHRGVKFLSAPRADEKRQFDLLSWAVVPVAPLRGIGEGIIGNVSVHAFSSVVPLHCIWEPLDVLRSM